jgi:alkanesulfonate monooxygenase SsuD/methylene tetrahydromethanopterin reductase-like flavin-dependent oxidoreductase (luciferase family)
VGVGWSEQEFAVLRVPFNRRGAITNEYLAAIKTLWTRDVASFEGHYVAFQDVHTAPRPVRTPHPPIWVGGASDAALRRTIQYGDAWHPIRMRVDWLRETGLPRLRQLAADAGKPVPALCPRIRLRITETPMPEEQRVAGEGTLDQLYADLKGLQDLSAQYVLFDTFYGDVEAIRQHETAWRMLTSVAEQVVDLPHGALR